MLLAILALTDVNAPLTADLSALVAMLVAMLELKLAVAIPTSTSVAKVASKDELKLSKAAISVAMLALVAVIEPLIVAAVNDLIKVAFAPKDPEMPAPVNERISVALAPNDPDIPVLFALSVSNVAMSDAILADVLVNDPDILAVKAFVAILVASDALKLAVAATNSASVVNILSKEELNASLAVILPAKDELVVANAPDTAVLSALVFMSVAIEALVAVIDPLISAAI